MSRWFFAYWFQGSGSGSGFGNGIDTGFGAGTGPGGTLSSLPLHHHVVPLEDP